MKVLREIRDPIHVFIRLDTAESKVLDSRPMQRLRHIHQLALSYLVYPGTTHRRFEHCLGVMELAGRVFDVVTHRDAVTDEVRRLLPELLNDDTRNYWRRVVRMAALCHDLGHLPFSHAAEHELLPDGWSHENITTAIVLSDEMEAIWSQVTPPLRPEDIAKLAVGPRKAKGPSFSNLEAILSEIVVGDAFGVDRMDYLLRDSHHAGVAYGKFDHYRLIDTLRILPSPPSEPEAESSQLALWNAEGASQERAPSSEPALGIEDGGLQSAEALLLARFFMFSQVYFHAVRRVYDIHLRDFLREWLTDGKFPISIDSHLTLTDNEVTAAMVRAARDPGAPGHDPARRIIERQHFRVLYQRHPADVKVNPEAGLAVFNAAKEQFGAAHVRHDKDTKSGGAFDFPVLTRDNRVVSSMSVSDVLNHLPVVAIEYVFISPEKRDTAVQWLEENRESIIQGKGVSKR